MLSVFDVKVLNLSGEKLAKTLEKMSDMIEEVVEQIGNDKYQEIIVSTEYDKMVEANQKDIATLENSPLKSFKNRFDEILSESMHAGKIQQFIEVRNSIESGKISADLDELRKVLLEIDEGVFGFVPDPNKE